MHRLTQGQFRDALRKGLGRAVLHVREFGAAGVEEDVIQACKTSWVYDPFCEGTRSEWLHEILTSAGLTSKVVPLVIDTLRLPSTEEEFWTVAQLCVLASLFAREGHEEARKALYEKFDRNELPDMKIVAIPVVNADGISGLLYVANAIGRRIRDKSEARESEWLFSEACDRLGRETVTESLASASKTNENIRAFANQVRMAEEDFAARQKAGPAPPDPLQTVLDAIEMAQEPPHRLRAWGRRAAEQDIAVIFERMLAEERPAQLRCYLRIFLVREMPRVEPRILEVARSDDQDLRWAATHALANIKAPQIRSLGISMLKETPPLPDAIRLFAKNHEPGDSSLLESVLPASGDAESLHSIGLDLWAVTSETKASELAGCMQWLYEYTPCSMCREGAVDYLNRWGALSRAMIEECLYDSSDETRALAKSLSAQSSL